MARAENQELIERFEQFYRRYYADEVGELARQFPDDRKSLYVDWLDLFQFDPDIAEDFVSQPGQMREYAEEALRLYDLPVDVNLGGAHVRLRELEGRTDIREIRSRHVNTLVSVTGMVRKATDVRPKVTEAAFECQRCGTLNVIPQSSGGFQEPHECQGCERQGPFEVNYDQSEFVDAQKLRIQESPEGLRGGETPQSIDVNIEDDVTGEVAPGDHVTLTGVLRLDQQERGGEKTAMFDVYMDGWTVEIEDEEFEDMEITEEDKEEIIELSQRSDIYETMVASMAPSIYGFEEEKLSMILQLFSGVTKHLPDGSRTRGDLHMLLIGDPGTGKCLAGDTKVTLEDGREREIREIVESNLDNPKLVDDGFYDEVDFAVPSLQPDGTITTQRATRVWKREAPDQLYHIGTHSGRNLKVTPSHPLYIPGPSGHTTTQARDLRVGDAIATHESAGGMPPLADGGCKATTPRGWGNAGDHAIPSENRRKLEEEGGGIRWERIESIEAVEPSDEWVYDLEVEETHNYLSNGIVSHNSALLQYIGNIAPRSIYTSGKGSSAAGLTAAAVRDDFADGQQWSLEAGALVLADKGLAAVDELDKMEAGDRSAMHEALEQQSYHPDTEVLLGDGRRVEIGQFVEEQMDERADEVIDGIDCEILPLEDITLHSVDLETNETTKQPADRVSRHEAPDRFVRVTFSNGREVTVTPEHPMFVDSSGGVGTVPAEDLEEGAFVPAPRKLPNSAKPRSLEPETQRGKERDVELPEVLSTDLAELLGLLVAEGHSYAGSAHEIGFSNQDPRLLNWAADLMRRTTGLESTDTTNAEGTVTKRWVSTKLYRWFERNFPEFMETARQKRIPAAILGASEEHIRRFLVGAFAGDGGVESEAMAFSTASEGLAEDYADALAKIGVASRIHHDIAEDSWKIYVMGDSTEKFLEKVVESADERYEDAKSLADRSAATPRHHDVLPPTAAAEIRALRRLVGLPLTGRFYQSVDQGYGVQIETVQRALTTIEQRISTVRELLDDTDTVSEIRSVANWSGRQLADRLAGVTSKNIHYAEASGYDAEKRDQLAERAEQAVAEALSEAEDRVKALNNRCDLRFYRVKNVETLPNEGEYETDWVYDVTIEPTNTFVSKGVVLHNSVSISKAGINATLQARCSLLGAANPKYGRFDQYEPIGEQIDLEPALISRFDLIFTVSDQPDEEEDRELAEHILQTNYAGELSTHRAEVTAANVSEEDVAEQVGEVEPAIDAELLRKYIAHAKSSVYPTMSETARERIKEFYVDLRSEGQGEDEPVPVTARQLEALVRLSEASARVRLSDTVTEADAERVIDIVRASLKDIGIDPETGKFDADVVEVGQSKTQRDRAKSLRGLIGEIETEYEEGAPVEEVLDRAEEAGHERSKAEHEIEKLKQKGEVYQPTQGHLRTT